MNIKSYVTKRRIYRYGMLIFGILLLLIILITYYGQYTGTFVLDVEEDAFKKGIVISTDPEFKTSGPSLFADPATQVRDITYNWLRIDEAIKTNGDYKDPKYDYVAFTFYVKNIGKETCNIISELNITEATKGIEKAIRFLIIENDITKTVYQAVDEVEKDYSDVFPDDVKIEYFVSDNLAFKKTLANVRPEQVNKYTIFIWLEGEDPDCLEHLKGARLKTNLELHVEGTEKLTDE